MGVFGDALTTAAGGDRGNKAGVWVHCRRWFQVHNVPPLGCLPLTGSWSSLQPVTVIWEANCNGFETKKLGFGDGEDECCGPFAAVSHVGPDDVSVVVVNQESGVNQAVNCGLDGGP